MSDLHQDIEPHDVAFGQVYRGIAKSSPSRLQGGIDIMIPDINPDIEFQNVRSHVMEDDFRPRVGDEVLVIFDNNNQPWIISWAPGIPVGGTVQQVLFKNSATDYDASWKMIAQGDLPTNLQGQELQPVAGNDANQALATGWYRLDTGATNGPDSARYWHLFVQNMFGNQIRQTAYAIVSDDLRVRRNDSGVWGSWYLPAPKFTTKTLASGPPASPSDGDIWIASAVEAVNLSRWQFQYDGPNTRWRFIGGPPVTFWATQSGPTWAADAAWHAVGTAFTAPRQGLYTFSLEASFFSTVSGQQFLLGLGLNGAIQAQYGTTQNTGAAAGQFQASGYTDAPMSINAGNTGSAMFWANGGGTPQILQATMSVLPIYIF